MQLQRTKHNCVNYKIGGQCPAVVMGGRCGFNCPFHCTEIEQRLARKRTAARLRSLPAELQAAIAQKYYPKEGLWWWYTGKED